MSEIPQRVVLTVGLPGSGKSTYLRRLGANAISSDDIRRQLMDDEADQTANRAVFAVALHILKQRIELKRGVTYVDATSITRRARKPFLKVALERGCRLEAVWFDIPLAICMARNAGRERVVPAFVLDHMAARFIPPSLDEGFDRVERIDGTVVSW